MSPTERKSSNRFKPIVPNAKLTFNAKTGKLAAWATPREQETIKASLVKLSACSPWEPHGSSRPTS